MFRKNLFLIFLPVLVFTLSCGSLKNNPRKMVIGNWKNAQLIQKEENNNDAGGSADGNDILQSMEFKADQSATLTYKNKVITGNWSIDKAGKTISVTEKLSGKVTEIHLGGIFPQEALGVIEPSSDGDRIIKFLRQN